MSLTYGHNTLRKIGEQLDRGMWPRVMRGGIVVPSDSATPYSSGPETQNVCAPRTEAGIKTSREKGAREASSPRAAPQPPGPAASVICRDSRDQYRTEIKELLTFYPGLRAWEQEDGFWVLSGSALLPGSSPGATFLTGILCSIAQVRSWGFWGFPALSAAWIGPRHTNSPDGSVCAFDPIDGSWIFGDPLLDFLDLHSLWALRHLHLRVFGRWPGLQSSPFDFERRIECAADEICGCGRSGLSYAACCQAKDSRENLVVGAVRYGLRFGLRRPPEAICRFVYGQADPPSLERSIIASPSPFEAWPIPVITRGRTGPAARTLFDGRIASARGDDDRINSPTVR